MSLPVEMSVWPGASKQNSENSVRPGAGAVTVMLPIGPEDPSKLMVTEVSSARLRVFLKVIVMSKDRTVLVWSTRSLEWWPRVASMPSASDPRMPS